MAKSIDPHIVFDNLRNVEVENLSFFAELKVTRRNRMANAMNGDDTFTLIFNGYNEENLYTTDWTEGMENFGIRSIDIDITASYVPKVYVEFIDVRGQALFTDAPNSKYKCMFELPPPIFDLTIKGYYGKPVSYRLHMVKQNTRWERGSYIIRAEFVGLTFAPLSDMMIDYVNVASFLNGNLNDKSYVNFIKTTKKVMNLIEKEVNSYMVDISEHEEKITKLKEINEGGDVFENLKTSVISFLESNQVLPNYRVNYGAESNDKVFTIYGKRRNNNEDGDTYEEHSKIHESLKTFLGEELRKYDEIIPNNKTVSSQNFDKLLLAKSEFIPLFTIRVDNAFNSVNKINELIAIEEKYINEKKGALDESKKSIAISEGDITLKNVLAIILENAKVFYNELKSLVANIEAKNRGGNAGKSNDLAKYAFPEFWGDKIEGGISKTVKMHPNGGEYDSWDENNFINRYIEAKKQVNIQLADINEMNTTPESESYISIRDFYEEYYKKNSLVEILDDFIVRNIELKTYFDKIIKTEGYDNEITFVANELNKKTLLGDEFLNGKYTSNGYRDFIMTLPSFNKYKNYVYPNKNSVKLIDYHTENVDLSRVVVDNKFFLTSNTTYENHPIYIGDEYYDKGSGQYTSNFDPKALNDYYKSFMKDLFKNKSRVLKLDEFCEILKDNLNNHVRFGDYFTSKPSGNLFQYLYDFINYIGFTEINTHKGHGIYVVPRIYLILFRYMHGEDLKKIPDLYNICNTEYNRYRGQNVVISEEMTWLAEPSSFADHENVKHFFEAVNLRIVGNDVYGSSEEKLGIIEEEMRKNVDLERLNNGLMKIRKKLTELRESTNGNVMGTAETRINASIEQSELRTQLYYTFKSFVDKWIYSAPSDVENMFSLDNFMTVDRGFNDIGGDVIMDLSPLYSLEYSVDTSLYTLLLNLLGKNNFNFFALPSYINYSENNLWSDANIREVFGLHQPTRATTTPKFICMYVGGVSSSLDIKSDNSFGSDSGTLDELIGMENVQSFRVDIGSGNQSFFTDVELDQQEYKETNESILLLDEITKNNGNSNKIATNSLINIYEQRSYTATIPMLGCAMIQPTMYFELNVPMFKGTYLILEVRHNLQPNKMTTTFKGVRVPKASKPYVNNMQISTTSSNGETFGQMGSYGQSASIASFFKGSTLVSNAKATVKERALLDMIAWAEGMDDYKSKYLGYDIMIGGKTIPGWTPETPGKFPNTNGNYSSATGRYQIMGDTWNNAWNGKFKNLDFSITNQDEVALTFIREQFRAFNKLNLENVNQTNFVLYVDALAPKWASLPFHNKAGNYKFPNVNYRDENWKPGLNIYKLKNGRNQWNPKNTIQRLWEIFSESVNVGENKVVNLTSLSKDNAKVLGTLHPQAQNVFANFIRDVERNTNFNVILTSGFRNYIPTDAEYTPATYSLHMVGLAIDMNIVNRENGLHLKQASSKDSWLASKVPAIAQKYNLYWGGNFSRPDKIHFELMDGTGIRFSGEIMNKYLNGNRLTNLNALSYQAITDINNKRLT